MTIRATIDEGGTIAIYGDYDADGVTACAMLTRSLRALAPRSFRTSPTA